MAYIAPNSTVWLYKGVPLDPNYENTYWFASKAAQKTAFDAYLAYTFTEQSYCRATGNAIRVQRNPDDLINCNYMAFKNTSFGDKIFYAFIDEVAYINNSTAEIRFTIDVLQTYFRDITFLPSYIEREHSATDDVGDNIVPEPSIGSPKLVINRKSTDDTGITPLISDNLMKHNYLVIATNAKYFLSDDLLDNRTPLKVQFPQLPGGRILFFGDLVLVECDNIDSAEAANTLLTVLKRFVEAQVEYYDNKGKAVIEDMYIVPKACATGLTWYATTPPNLYYDSMIPINSGTAEIQKVSVTDSLDELQYFPKNKKLYTAPFTFLRITTNSGSYIDYPYELIDGDKAYFKWEGSCLNGSGRIFGGISNYKSSSYNMVDKTLNLEFNSHIQQPINPDNSAAYMWQDKLTNFGLHLASTAISIPFQVYNANTRINSAVSRAEKKGEEVAFELPVPEPSLSLSTGSMAGGQTSVTGCDTTKLYGNSNFYAMQMCYDKATLVQYDNFFTRYGYAVNEVKFPNFIKGKGRQTFNYVKTNGASIIAKDAPADAVAKIKSIFDSGTTVWLQLSNVGNFGLSNNIIV